MSEQKTPITVYFSDAGEGEIYKLTKSQLEDLAEKDDWKTADKFKMDTGGNGFGYVPDYLVELAAIYGFEVDSI